MPHCEGEFNPPELVSPINFEIIDPDAPYTFNWLMLNCLPKWYDIKVFYNPHTQGPTIINEEFETTSMSWETNLPLEPLTTYDWRLIAVSWESDSNWFASDWDYFTTGPVCDPNEMVAPLLIYPADGSVYTGKSWGNPFEVEADIVYPSETCIPERFTFYISETQDFSTPNLNFFSPEARISRNPDNLLLFEDDSNDVPDCSTLYWKAWGTIGETDGPESEIFSFYTNIEGNCFILPQWTNLPYLIAPQNINCRASDYSSSKNLDTLLEGEEVLVLAVNPEATHAMILEPRFKVNCWVWLGVVDLMKGDMPFDPSQLLDLVSVQDPPEEPTSTPASSGTTTATDTPTPPQCSDGIDNDGDGKIDYGVPSFTNVSNFDPECTSADDNDESN